MIASGGRPCWPDNGFRDIEISRFKEIQRCSRQPAAYTTHIHTHTVLSSQFSRRGKVPPLVFHRLAYPWLISLDLWLMPVSRALSYVCTCRIRVLGTVRHSSGMRTFENVDVEFLLLPASAFYRNFCNDGGTRVVKDARGVLGYITDQCSQYT